ncbi:hypothetical protein ES705_40766 [subsurface metagenome]
MEVVCGSTFKEIRRGVMAGMFYLMDLALFEQSKIKI